VAILGREMIGNLRETDLRSADREGREDMEKMPAVR
jgi:hypothetical protein